MSGITNAVLREMKARTAAALTNEQVTRRRVDDLEQHAAAHAQAVADFVSRPLRERLRWLFLGR